MSELIYKEEAYKIVGACFEVYKHKGSGFTEPMYQECLQIELTLQNIPFVAQPQLQLDYKGNSLTQFFKPDFICFGKIIIEIKSLERLANVHRAQTLNYLNATGYELALLVNFGGFPKLEYERIVNTKKAVKSKTIWDEMRDSGNGSINFLAIFRVFRGQNSYVGHIRQFRAVAHLRGTP